jgi:hypothetical protein
MKMIVVGMDDGIILDLNRCVILDEDAIGDADQRLLNFGTESDALAVADRHGAKLSSILEGCGYGDLHYGNCLALTPNALRDEFVEIPTLLVDVPESIEGVAEIKEVLTWGASLNNNQMRLLASYILQDDELWTTWRTAVVTALEWMHTEHNTETDKS